MQNKQSVAIHCQFSQEWPSHSLGSVKVCDMQLIHVRNALALVYARFNKLLDKEGVTGSLNDSEQEASEEHDRAELNDLRAAQLLGQENKGPLTFQRDYLRSNPPVLAPTRECLIQQMVLETIFKPKFSP